MTIEMSEVNYFRKDYNDPFLLDASNSADYVVGDIKPAYSLFLDSFDIPNFSIEEYMKKPQFQINYDNSRKNVDQYVKDLYLRSKLLVITKSLLHVFVANYDNKTYVIKGEFILRVINDFILGKIKLAGKTYEQFKDDMYDNYEYEDGYKEQRIELQETTLTLSKEKPLSDYIYLLDRYEVYDEEFIEDAKNIVDVFIF